MSGSRIHREPTMLIVPVCAWEEVCLDQGYTVTRLCE